MTIQNSKDRVRHSADRLGLTINIVTMPKSTRTAAEAALACRCAISQIVKSIILADRDNGNLILFLISGDNRIDLSGVEYFIQRNLIKAEPKIIRQKTGFSIGGVSPIGHLTMIPIYLDPRLLEFKTVWAAAGTPNSVFSVDPYFLGKKIGALRLPLDCLIQPPSFGE